MDITYIPDISQEDRDVLTPLLDTWRDEVRALLGDASTPSKIVFNNYFLIPETGTGGFADHDNVLVLAFDPNFPDREAQLKSLRSSYFHESYHIVQQWLGDTVLPAIDEAILEGAATVFERDRTDSTPLWGVYDDNDQYMKGLVAQVLNLPSDYDVQKWKYLDEETNEKWILYKVGVYIVDMTLKNKPSLTIESIATMSSSEILTFSKLII